MSGRRMQRFAERGFSITELMVAMLIGLIVSGGVATVLFQSKKNYTVQDSTARLQENARFALDFMSFDVRMAGYLGCHDNVKDVHSQVNGADAQDPTLEMYEATRPIDAVEAGSNSASDGWQLGTTATLPSDRVDGSDMLSVRYLDPSPIQVVDEMPSETAELRVAKNSGLVEGQVVLVSDCASADIFQITDVDDDSGSYDALSHATGSSDVPGNASAALSKPYSAGAEIAQLVSMIYYIGTGVSGQPALKRIRVQATSGSSSPVTEELVEGVESMQILFGEDTDRNDDIPDKYVKASAVTNWEDVKSIRIALLVASIAATETGEYLYGADKGGIDMGFEGASADVVSSDSGNRQRRRFVTTLQLRNTP